MANRHRNRAQDHTTVESRDNPAPLDTFNRLNPGHSMYFQSVRGEQARPHIAQKQGCSTIPLAGCEIRPRFSFSQSMTCEC